MADSVTKNVNVVISAVDQYSGNMGMFAGSFGKIATAAVAAEVAILAASIAAAKFAVSIGQDVFKSAVDFHDAIFDVSAVANSFGTSGEEIEGVLDRLVQKFPVTGAEGGKALQLIAQMGKGTKEELETMADAAVTLQIATGTDLETAARTTLATMNAFGLGIEDTARVTNLLAQTSFTSAASVSDLGEGLKYSALTASQMGISLEETVAVMGIFRNVGLEGSQTGTTFRRAMTQLMKQTDRGAAALKKYGLTYDDVNPSIQSVADVIDKFGGKTITAKDAVDLLGIRGMAFAKIINEGGNSLRDYTGVVSDTTANYDAAAIKLGKWSVVMENFGGSMDIFKKDIGKSLVPALVEFVGKDEHSGIRAVITSLNEMEKAVGGLGGPMLNAVEMFKSSAKDAFTDSFGGAEEFYIWLVHITEALSANLQAVTIWGSAFSTMFFESVSNVDTLKKALSLVNFAFTVLGATVATFHDSFVIWTSIWGVAIDAVQWLFNRWVVFILSGAELILKGLNAIGWDDYTKEIEWLGTAAEKFKKKAGEAFDTKAPTFWIDNVMKTSAKMIHVIDGVTNKTREMRLEAFKTGEGFASWVKEFGTTKAEKMFEALKRGTDEWGESVEKLGVRAQNAIGKAAVGIEEGMQIVSKGVSEMANQFRELEIQSFKGGTGFTDWVAQFGEDQANAMVEALKKTDTAYVDWAEKFGSDAAPQMKKVSEGITASVTKLTQETVKLGIEAFTTGQQFGKWIEEFGGTQANAMVEALRKGGTGFKDWVGQFGEAAATEMKKGFGEIVAGMEGLSESVADVAKETEVWVQISEEGAQKMVKSYAEAGKTISIDYARSMTVLNESTESVTETAKQTNEELSKLGEHKLTLEVKKYESDLKMAEEAMKNAGELAKLHLEWEAKLDISQIEAGTKRMEISANRIIGVMGEMTKSIGHVSEGTSSMFGDLATAYKDDISGLDKWNLEDVLDAQVTQQQTLVDAQVKLASSEGARAAAQTERILLENERIANGESVSDISVSVEGDTEGWLEGLMQSLFEEIMIKAQAEAFKCLCESTPTA